MTKIESCENVATKMWFSPKRYYETESGTNSLTVARTCHKFCDPKLFLSIKQHKGTCEL